MTAAAADALLQRAMLARGVELHFVEQGAGPPVVLLHGGLGDCRSWEAQMRPLAEHHRVVAYSRRHSSPNRNPETPHSLERDVDDLAGLLHQLQTGPAHLVATSYGALVALAYALERPDHVLSLVLAEPPLHRWVCTTSAGAALYEAFLRDAWHPASAAFARGSDRLAVQLLIDGMWGGPVFESLPPQRQALALRNTAAMRLHTQARDPFPNLPRAAVEELAIPSLLVRGEQSNPLHRSAVAELAGAMASARSVVIGGAGHGSPSEQPAQFNAAVLGFLPARAGAGAPASLAKGDDIESASTSKGRP
ncbi:MAG: alpha/beta hydrolase [Caldimonas sp.]